MLMVVRWFKPSPVKWTVEQVPGGIRKPSHDSAVLGSAPIQNIGAYGVELQDICGIRRYSCLDTYTVKRLSKEECLFFVNRFDFKHALYGKAIVVAIGLTSLAKHGSHVITMAPWKVCLKRHFHPQTIFNEVCAIHWSSKLPDLRSG